MDFFEKAHVVKRESSKKERKPDEAVKKQLKQMLHGYKQCDSNLINACGDEFDPNKLLDEPTSASDFSDLNLTNSSHEADTTRCTVGSDSEDYKVIFIDDPRLRKSDFDPDCSIETLDLTKESTKTDENIETLSDNVSAKFTIDSKSNTSSDIVSLELSQETDNDYEESEFDADGVLANKILEKLNNRSDTPENVEASDTEGLIADDIFKKLKDKGETSTDNDPDESDFDAEGVLADKILKKLKIQSVKKKGQKRKLDSTATFLVSELNSEKNFKDTSTDSDVEDNSQFSVDKSIADVSIENVNDTDSSDFISIAAPSSMPMQTLSEIIGEYTYPTVRNIPESQNLHATINSGSFSVQNLNTEDIHIEDVNLELQDTKESEADDVNLSTDLDNSHIPISLSPSNYDDSVNTTNYDDASIQEMSVESDANFLNPIKVYYGKSRCIFVLKHPVELYIHGKVEVTAINGTVEVFGYTLQDTPCEIFAPNYNYALNMKTVERKNLADGLFAKLRSEGLSIIDAEEIVTELEEYDGVVSLKRLNSHKIDFIESSITSKDFFSKTSKNVDNYFKTASEKLGCSFYLTRPYKVFEDLSCWKEVIELGYEGESRGIICGGKGVGKSTFLRYCVNRLLSRGPVLVIDLDPGQAEFTVAGNISATVVETPLLGPNFTHLKTPNIMLNIGMINTMDNPRRYATAVSTLINHCNNDESLKSMPWLVNTMGMCNSMGLQFITKIILETQPTYLLEITARNPKKRFATLLNPENVKRLYENNFYNDSLFRDIRHQAHNLDYAYFIENHTDSSPRNSSSMGPKDERYLNFMAYFSELLNSQRNTLLGITPYQVSLRDLHIGLNVGIRDDALAKVINGKIIALCQLTAFDNAGRVFTLKDKPLLCHGHGLVRGIDFEKEILYVITPIPVDKLSLVDTLVYADWVPELRGQEKTLPETISVPYRAVSMYQQRQLMYTPRRRFNPLQLLKMTRNS